MALWKRWAGGPWQKDVATVVSVKLRGGNVSKNDKAAFWGAGDKSNILLDNWNWKRRISLGLEERQDDIIAYKIEKEIGDG